MHPQLSDKRTVCWEFIQALEMCHMNTWAKFTGGCNTQKDELNKCLRKERIARTTRNREAAKEQRAKTEQAWKDFNED
ncbi:hypothetical protein EYR40_001126 [Pleurotus pulmonarius]|nr:hypothetical protein EYR36_004857 [Pleurotus pulmonarius]KAF4578717.1 hypothetical protein EYR36_000524 [Pleurotus pulmonarius]KAF4603951.1 hypothetical protein EYR38_004367 [Pleurotus pulmonarius]KAF4608779.1 hypothetical protein EYR40_001126 [Pleurotus pulmonarius]